VAKSITSGEVDLAFMCIIFTILAIRNFNKWGIGL
jgi:hypothetical protein